ncbi:hypothetical protein LENED_003732 [Lentinula edodes]|uniref:Uncharacterized protein n=1 Tax=Lentinula edodes TaxID=5353 RepID=A0A1Q3E4D3_LENED|nr:hypothetical protein LENED_003732 [Lentinula edodes]
MPEQLTFVNAELTWQIYVLFCASKARFFLQFLSYFRYSTLTHVAASSIDLRCLSLLIFLLNKYSTSSLNDPGIHTLILPLHIAQSHASSQDPRFIYRSGNATDCSNIQSSS